MAFYASRYYLIKIIILNKKNSLVHIFIIFVSIIIIVNYLFPLFLCFIWTEFEFKSNNQIKAVLNLN